MTGETGRDNQKDEPFDFRDLFFFGNEDPEDMINAVIFF